MLLSIRIGCWCTQGTALQHSKVSDGKPINILFLYQKPSYINLDVSIQGGTMSHKILIVDDEALSREALLHYLEAVGYQVDQAENGMQAYERLSSQQGDYAAVVLDWMMPEMTGIELVQKLQQSPDLSTIPVVMLTSVDERDKIINAVQAGVFDYLIKPVDKDLLINMVAKAVEIEHV